MLSPLPDFIISKLDFWLFAVLAFGLLLCVYRLVLRRLGTLHDTHYLRLGFLLFMTSAWLFLEHAEHKEKDRLQSIMESAPLVYASEMQRMGHSRITPTTPATDETYLRLIEAEERWLHTNHKVSNIYTFRPTIDGKCETLVDSESDLDQNGLIEGPRETRSKIGEAIQPPREVLTRVLAGEIGFNGTPRTDRWGTWISAYAPIHNEAGEIEAVLGVDMDASQWAQAISEARLTMLGYLSAVFIFINAIMVLIAVRLLARENAKQKHIAEQIEHSRSRLEDIINTIDGIVWEWNVQSQRFVFVSTQVREVLGIESTDFEDDPKLWHDRVHPADMEMVRTHRNDIATKGGSYCIEYRYERADGKEIWLRERGAAVAKGTGKAVCLRGVMADVTASRESAAELETINRQLIETSRQAGMAEVASGVLHNVGNVLNSVNVSSTVITDTVRESKVRVMEKLAKLITAQADDLASFFTKDPRGLAMPKFLNELARELRNEQQTVLKELQGLVRNVTHIKQIVMMQQSYARTGGSVEPVDAADLIEDALRINESALIRHGIQVHRVLSAVPAVMADRNKVMQILINLIRNAKHALTDRDTTDRRLTIKIASPNEAKVSICISDNGKGMSQDTLGKLFSYGFTTKKHGHGFGLHSGANAAREMGGALTAESPGEGRGSTFKLDLPTIHAPVPTPRRPMPSDFTPTMPLPTVPALASPQTVSLTRLLATTGSIPREVPATPVLAP